MNKSVGIRWPSRPAFLQVCITSHHVERITLVLLGIHQSQAILKQLPTLGSPGFQSCKSRIVSRDATFQTHFRAQYTSTAGTLVGLQGQSQLSLLSGERKEEEEEVC